MGDELERIGGFVEALARRERALLIGRVALHGVALVAVVAVLAALAVAGQWQRPAAAALLVLVAGIGAWAVGARPLAAMWRPAGDRLRQARLVEALSPELRGRFVVLVERVDGSRPGESAALLRMIVRRASAALESVSVDRVHSWSTLRRPALVTVVATLVAVCASAWVGPSGVAGWWFGGGDALGAAAGPTRAAPEDLAEVGDIVLRYVYPEYTGLEEHVVTNSTGEAHGPPGTRVEVSARAAAAIEAAALVAYDDPALDAAVADDGRTVSGSLTIREDAGSYRLLTYLGGVALPTRAFTITPELDLAPDVSIDDAPEVIEIAADGRLALRWRARDDYGIRRVEVELDGTARGAPLAVPRERRAEVVDELLLRPTDLGLTPGSRARLTIAAWDNDTVGGTKRGRSAAIELVVLGPRGLDAREEDRRRALMDEMIEVLADHLEEDWPPGLASGQLAAWGEAVAGRYVRLDELVERFGAGLTDTPEGEAVARVARSARELVRYTQVAFTPGARERAPAASVDATAELRSAAILELENGIYALDRMLRARALSEVARQAELLQASAANLAEMLEDGADPVEMLARLEALERTLQKVMENAAKLDDGGLKEFVNSRGQEAQSLIEEIREAIREGRTDEARELMERLQRAVQEMSEGIEDNLEQMNQQSSELAQMAEDLGAQLEQLEADQRSLQEQVTELREKSDAASAERAEDLWEKAEQLAGEAVKLGDRYAGGVRRAGRSFAEQERSDNGVAETARLKDAIEGRDLDGAYRGLNEARRAWGHADTLRTLEELSKGRELLGPGPDAMLAIEDGLDAVEKVLRELLELSDEVEPETREQVRELREQQRELDERLDSARQSAQEFTREMPVKPDGMEDALERAGEQMSRAEGALGAGQPMPAEGAMGAAAQEIADAREAMDRAMQQMQQMQQQGEGGEGGEQDAQRGREGQPMESLQVEIPRPEDYIVPEEYRRALLEGMEGEVPDEYRSMKKRYYEELVQQ